MGFIKMFDLEMINFRLRLGWFRFGGRRWRGEEFLGMVLLGVKGGNRGRNEAGLFWRGLGSIRFFCYLVWFFSIFVGF